MAQDMQDMKEKVKGISAAYDTLPEVVQGRLSAIEARMGESNFSTRWFNFSSR